jgi:tetratricopeptide (TPR) repeat protein
MCGLRLERAYTSLHDDTKAIETALELQRAYPDDPEVLYYSSKIFGNQAFLSAQKLFQTAPNSTWGMMAAAEAHESQGSLDQAIAEYREVLKLDPARPNVHFRIGRALLSRGANKGDAKDLEAAQTEFQQELDFNPSSANAAYELAEIYRKQGHEEQARKYFQQAVDSYPAFEEAYIGLALTQLETDPASARTLLQKAVTLDRQDPVA